VKSFARFLSSIGPRRPVVLLLLCLLALLPAVAQARRNGCSTTGTTPVLFSPPATITVSFNAPNGTLLYTSPLIAPTNPPTVTCSGTSYYGVVDRIGATPGTGVNVYPTSVAGLGYSITHDDLTTYLYPYPCCQIPANTYLADISSSLQLIKTGPIISGSTLPAGLIGDWQFDPGINIESFTLANSVTIIDPACSVDTTPIAVTLPSVTATALSSIGATAGSTAFAVALTCFNNATLDIQLDYAGAPSGIPGVLTATSGASSGVGVQLLDKNFDPVVFGTKTLVGSTPAGALNINYYARYYRTAAVAPGNLTASATFTLSYE